MGQTGNSSELYNLRWNSYFTNLTSVFTEHQHQESLVDVTLGCDGQFIKAHKLVLSACSLYFQKIFQTHTGPQLLILLNDVKFDHLKMVVQFMYKGEVKVAEADMQQFLHLGKMLQVKGLCSVELQEKQKTLKDNNKPEAEASKHLDASPTPKATPSEPKQATEPRKSEEEPSPKKIKLVPQTPPKEVPTPVIISPPPPENKTTHIPRPPNAFMIFATQWRKKLAVEYPNESNKDISVRLGNMWKSLSAETKESFYEDAIRAEEEHQLKYPGYYYSPREARNRKAQAKVSKLDDSNEDVIEVKTEYHSDNSPSK